MNLHISHLRFLILLFVFINCSDVQRVERIGEDLPKYVVDDSKLDSYDRVMFSDYFDSMSYIPLETTKESLVIDIKEVVLLDNKIFVLEGRNGSILMFDAKGNFVTTVGGYGRGPGEYNYISNIQFSRELELIYALDKSIKKIFIYDFSGEFKSQVNLDFIDRIGDSFLLLENGNFLFPIALSGGEKDNTASYIEINQHGKVNKKYVSNLNVDYGGSVLYGSRELNDYGFGVKLVPRYLDRILEFKDGKVSTFIQISPLAGYDKEGISNFYEIRESKFKSTSGEDSRLPYNGIWHLGEFFETSRLIAFRYLYSVQGKPMSIIIDKRDGNIKRIYWEDDLNNEFTDPAFVSIQLPYFIKTGPVPGRYNYNLGPQELLDSLKRKIISTEQHVKYHDTIKERINGLDLASNPVLFIYRLKEEFQ